jgi:hypothetical protein
VLEKALDLGAVRLAVEIGGEQRRPIGGDGRCIVSTSRRVCTCAKCSSSMSMIYFRYPNWGRVLADRGSRREWSIRDGAIRSLQFPAPLPPEIITGMGSDMVLNDDSVFGLSLGGCCVDRTSSASLSEMLLS